MNDESIERELREQVAGRIRLAAEGPDRFRVFTPFVFDDGDHLAIVLRRDDAGWMLSDEGHTYMHLSRDVDGPDPHDGTRRKIVSDALAAFGIEDRGGELILRVRDHHYGDALYGFVQGLLRIAGASLPLDERAEA